MCDVVWGAGRDYLQTAALTAGGGNVAKKKTEEEDRGPWMQTYSGRQFYPLNPSPNDVDIKDIAQALSQMCRFNGHTDLFYSVGQHCVEVSQAVPGKFALQALLHDAAEAYVGDMIRPLKHGVPALYDVYAPIEDDILACVMERFSLPTKLPQEVEDADLLVLATEARDVMGHLVADWELGVKPLNRSIVPLDALSTKVYFMQRFTELHTRHVDEMNRQLDKATTIPS